MITLKDIKRTTTLSAISEATNILNSLGFVSLNDAFLGDDKQKLQSNKINHIHPHEQLYFPIAKELTAYSKIIRSKHILTYSITTKKNRNDEEAILSLHISGAKTPMADAYSVFSAHKILATFGIINTVVHINAIGTPETYSRYTKELYDFLKKNIYDSASNSIKTLINENPLQAYAQLVKNKNNLINNAPSAMEYINDETRDHLKQFLEFLDSVNIMYIFDQTLVCSPDYCETLIFEIRERNSGTDSKPISFGGRFGILSRKAFKQYLDVTGVFISFEKNCDISNIEIKKKRQKHNIYFAHISDNAKRIALPVLNSLVSEGLTINHTITSDSLGEQMQHSKKSKYIIIIGHKEATGMTAIVREVSSRMQVDVPLSELPKYIKAL